MGFGRFRPWNGLLVLVSVVLVLIPRLVFVDAAVSAAQMASLSLPSGFSIAAYRADVPGARSLCIHPLSTSGTLVFVGTRAGNVFALVDANNDGVAEESVTVVSGLGEANGVAVFAGALYVATVSSILRFPNIVTSFRSSPSSEVVTDAFPTDLAHGWKYIRFHPRLQDILYVPVGAPCNICERNFPYSSITTINVSQTNPTITPFVSGVRNSVGFAWDDSETFWFTENGRDNWGDNRPPDELNRVSAVGDNFGYPYCYGYGEVDPTFNQAGNCNGYIPAAMELGPHVAALGMEFVGASASFPDDLRRSVVIAEHGSWNRQTKSGYHVTLVPRDLSGKPVSYKVFIDGWKDSSGQVWGRPVDVAWYTDGTLLLSDDLAGAVYRITFSGDKTAPVLDSLSTAYPSGFTPGTHPATSSASSLAPSGTTTSTTSFAATTTEASGQTTRPTVGQTTRPTVSNGSNHGGVRLPFLASCVVVCGLLLWF